MSEYQPQSRVTVSDHIHQAVGDIEKKGFFETMGLIYSGSFAVITLVIHGLVASSQGILLIMLEGRDTADDVRLDGEFTREVTAIGRHERVQTALAKARADHAIFEAKQKTLAKK